MEFQLSLFDGHTPGPWKWEGDAPFLHATAGNVLYPEFVGLEEVELEGKEQDMALIAAAPELLAEVEKNQRLFKVIRDECKMAKDGEIPDADVVYAVYYLVAAELETP